MNTKNLVLVAVIAGAGALLTTYGFYKHNQSTHDAGVRNSSRGWQYLAAARNISDGERITPGDVMVVNWASDQPVVGAFAATDRAQVIGRIVSYPVANGQPFTTSLLAGPDSTMGLPHKIPAGFRAFSVKTSEANDLGGFLYPGAKVDILVALKASDRLPARTVCLVQDVLVLTNGKQMTPDPSGKPISGKVVTVLVTPNQAQKIALAQEQGTVYFSLRNGGDKEVSDQRPLLFSEMSGAPVVSPVAGRHRPPSTEERSTKASTVVETILGEHTSTQSFHGNLPITSPDSARPDAQHISGVQQ